MTTPDPATLRAVADALRIEQEEHVKRHGPGTKQARLEQWAEIIDVVNAHWRRRG